MTENTRPDERSAGERRPAIFLDRDGTINEDVGYAARPDEIHIYPYAAEAIRLLNRANLPVIIVTNQSGIARGYLDEAMLARLHDHLRSELARDGARIDAVYYCPHHPRYGNATYRRVCRCRKPEPGMLEAAAREYGINLAASYVIGDKASDIHLAAQAGARGVLVKTGYGEATLSRSLESGVWSLKSETGGGQSRSGARTGEEAGQARSSSSLLTALAGYICAPDLVADNLLEAVRAVLTEVGGSCETRQGT